MKSTDSMRKAPWLGGLIAAHYLFSKQIAMATYLLIIFIFAAGGTYDTDMLAMPNMDACQEHLSEVAKVITPTEGVSYILACLQARDTTEQPI